MPPTTKRLAPLPTLAGTTSTGVIAAAVCYMTPTFSCPAAVELRVILARERHAIYVRRDGLRFWNTVLYYRTMVSAGLGGDACHHMHASRRIFFPCRIPILILPYRRGYLVEQTHCGALYVARDGRVHGAVAQRCAVCTCSFRRRWACLPYSHAVPPACTSPATY